MKPYNDQGTFRYHDTTVSPISSSFSPDLNFAQGVEIRQGRNVFKASARPFISSGRWLDMQEDGVIDQEVAPSVLGVLIDPLPYVKFNDADERRAPSQILQDEEIVRSDTIDYSDDTSKDGRATVFNLNARSYIFRDEIPLPARGVKINNESIQGYSVGTRFSPYYEDGESILGIVKLGFHGTPSEVVDIYYDTVLTSSLGTKIDYDSFDPLSVYGSFGRDLYSAIFETDSVAYAGLLR
jgi:hypothetical protein